MPVKKQESTEAVRVRPRADRRVAKRPSPTQNDIAQRAYEFFLQRGGEHGRDWEDWLRAEQELSGRR